MKLKQILDRKDVPLDVKRAIKEFFISSDVIKRNQKEELILQRTHDLEERIKELTCLYSFSKLTTDPQRSMDDVIRETLLLIPPAWQYPEITYTRIIIDGNNYITPIFQETPWKQSADIQVANTQIGTIEVYYREERPESFEGPFLKEERDLIDALARELSKFIIRKKTEKMLKYQAKLLSNVSEAIISADFDYKILSWNKGAEDIYGWSEEEALGRTTKEVFQAGYSNEERKRLKEQLLANGVRRGEIIHKRKDGTRINIFTSVSLITDHNGTPKSVLAINSDITKRKKIEEELKKSETRWRSLAQNIPSFVAELNLEGKILSVNKVQPGLSRDDFIGKTIFEITPPEDLEHLNSAFSTVLKDHVPITYEHHNIGPDGTQAWYYHHIAPVLTEINELKSLIIVLTDITKIKLAEEAVRKSEEKYRRLFELVPVGIAIADFDGNLLSCNKRTLDLMGYSLEEIKTIDLNDTYVYPEDIDLVNKVMQESGKLVDFEVKLKRKDGTEYTSLLNVEQMDLEGQNVLLIAHRDITPWKEINRALQESEERLRAFMDSATDGFILLDSQLKYIDLNRVALATLGFTKEEMIGKNSLDFHPQYKESELHKQYNKVIKTGKPFILDPRQFRDKFYSVRAFKVGEGLGVMTSDITDREQAKQKLKKFSKQLELILDNVPAAVFYKDTKNNFIQVNKVIADVHNTTKEELAGRSLFDIYQHDVAQAYWDDDLEVVKGGKPKLNIIEPWDTPEGRKWVRTSKIPLKDENGEINGVLGFSEDITERKNAEEAQRESEKNFRTAKQAEEALQHQRDWLEVTLSSLGEAVISTDINAKITFINPVAKKLTGWSAQEALGRQVEEVFNIINEQKRQSAMNPVVRVLEEGKVAELENDTSLITQDGHEIPLAGIGAPIRNRHDEMQGVVLVFQDITERKQMEAEILQKRKLAALGQMAAGLAHELNTPLANINLTTEYILNLIETKSDSSKITCELNDIKEQTHYCGHIVKNFLLFSRKIEIHSINFKAQPFLSDILSLPSIRSRIREKNIKISLEIAKNINLMGDRVLLNQCFQNLIINSIDALNPSQPDPMIKISLLEYDDTTEISIMDNGEGITKENLQNIFDPFFTTRSVGKGTGLGLTLTRGIIEKHNGNITVKSTFGEGTEALVTLPRIAD